MKWTPCECDGPGWCARHHCLKNSALYHRCRRSLDAYNAWEAGDGPCLDHDQTADGCPGPGLFRRALNFGTAVVRHAVDQFRAVSDLCYEERLRICRSCPACDVPHLICRERSCGCFLETKARWASENCPLQKWPEPSDLPPQSAADSNGPSTIPDQSTPKSL